jgi:hypothetical protein
MTARQRRRQLKLGAVTMGAGGPGQHYLWLAPKVPGDASVNVDWYVEVHRGRGPTCPAELPPTSPAAR